MGANEIQDFAIKAVKNMGENCVFCVKKYPLYSCVMLFACILFVVFPSIFIFLVYSSPLVGFAFVVQRIFISLDRPNPKPVEPKVDAKIEEKVKAKIEEQVEAKIEEKVEPKIEAKVEPKVEPKSKNWRQLQSRRSFKSSNRVQGSNQNNTYSFTQDLLKDLIRHPSADKRDENPKESSSNSSHNRSDEEHRKSTLDNEKDKPQEEGKDVGEDNKKQDSDNGTKTVRWLDEAEKSLLDIDLSEDETHKRLESLMERRRTKKMASFHVRKNGTGIGIGNDSIHSLNIPKKNPFLADGSRDESSPAPVSAPSYMVKSNPFDLPYDPHEEKPILTGDAFEDEILDTKFRASRLGKFDPPEFTNDKQKALIESDFAIEQLPSGKLVTSTVGTEKEEVVLPPSDA